jgi:hypothetical protein
MRMRLADPRVLEEEEGMGNREIPKEFRAHITPRAELRFRA